MRTGAQLRFWLAAFAVFLLLLYLLSDILLPFVAGMAVAYFLDPAADRLQKWGCSRAVATTLITLIFVIAFVLLLVLLVPALTSQVAEFAGNVPDYLRRLREFLEPLIVNVSAQVSPQDLERARAVIGDFSQQAVVWIAGLLKGVAGVFSILSVLVITPVVTFYLIYDWDRMVAMIDGWLPRRHAATIRQQIKLVDATLAGFVRGQATVCFILATYYGIALGVVGLQFGLIVGIGAGLVSFVPYVGTLIGVGVGVGLALLQFDSIAPTAIVAGVFVVGQVLEGYVLTPRLVGKRIGLHPVWVIFALLAGGSLFGFVGMLLAVPTAAVIGVLVRFGLAQYLASAFFDGDQGGADPS